MALGKPTRFLHTFLNRQDIVLTLPGTEGLIAISDIFSEENRSKFVPNDKVIPFVCPKYFPDNKEVNYVF